MMRRIFFLSVPLVLAVMLGLLATPLAAEQLQVRYSSGNNVGFIAHLGWGGYGRNNTYLMQYPNNSGNYFACDRGPTWSAVACRDRDGDGLVEDTVAVVDGGAAVIGNRFPLELKDVIDGFAAAGIEPNSRMGNLPYAQVWSSLDPVNVTDWPIEAREGHTATGSPIFKGRETMFVPQTDVMVAYSNPPVGFYYGVSFYLLDYGDANNMVFGHAYVQNNSEYIKYNPSYGGTTVLDANHQDGLAWKGMIIAHHMNQPTYTARNSTSNLAGWALQSAKGIQTVFSKVPSISSFTPQEPYMIGLKLLRAPMWQGEEHGLNHFHVSTSSSEFGVSPVAGALASSLPHGAKYRACKGEYDYAPTVTNPFTGRIGLKGYPGLLEPTDTRYNQWIWGGNATAIVDYYLRPMSDFEPGDTTSFDFVYMYAYPGVSPFIVPPFALSEIDNSMMQEAFAPIEAMAEAAEQVFAAGLKSPRTPTPPALTIVPGDRQVTITWSDLNVTTPDSFYYDLQEIGGDPDGNYVEYDFAGYRLYRNFRGPNNAGAELIYDSDEEGVRYFHVDRLSDDDPFYRMKNGQKVWYSLVPFDLNYSPASGEAFSLPDTGAGKTWNQSASRPGRATDVIPRSDASNYKPAYVSGVEFFPIRSNVEPIYALTYNIPGDANAQDDGPAWNGVRRGASGKLNEPLKYLAPAANISVTPVNPEKITTQTKVNLAVDYGSSNYKYFNNFNYSRANIKFVLQDGAFSAETGTYQGYGVYGANSVSTPRYTERVSFDLNGAVDNAGASYALSAEFQGMYPGTWRVDLSHWFDDGGYAADSVLDVYNSVEAALPYNRGAYTPNMFNYFRSGTYEIKWLDAGGGNLTIEVVDITRNDTLPFVEYVDDGYGWGLVLPDEMFEQNSGDSGYRGPGWNKPINNTVYGVYFREAVRSPQVPRDQRSKSLHRTLPANNTAEFGVWIGGQYLRVEAPNDYVTAMPSPGTVFTFSRAFGSWNSDGTIFTQWAEPPFVGDRWVATIEPTTTNPEDADFSKIRVVPNPYVGSSFLDYSPDARRIEFVNLPANCTIRIYSLGGNLVNVLNHIGSNRSGWGNYTDIDNLTLGTAPTYQGYDNHGGTEPWNMRNRFGQTVSSGLYFYHVTDERGKTISGRFYIIN